MTARACSSAGAAQRAPDRWQVEIGYAVAPEWQGRGLATCAVRAMLREAYAAPEVKAVYRPYAARAQRIGAGS